MTKFMKSLTNVSPNFKKLFQMRDPIFLQMKKLMKNNIQKQSLDEEIL